MGERGVRGEWGATHTHTHTEWMDSVIARSFGASSFPFRVGSVYFGSTWFTDLRQFCFIQGMDAIRPLQRAMPSRIEYQVVKYFSIVSGRHLRQVVWGMRFPCAGMSEGRCLAINSACDRVVSGGERARFALWESGSSGTYVTAAFTASDPSDRSSRETAAWAAAG